MSLYQRLADQLQYISPSFYKKRFFKKQIGLTYQNFLERKVEPELLWVTDNFKKDHVIMDVGANVGSYLYALENKVNPQNIYAFEPNQKLYKRLKRIFPNIYVSPIALSNENTTAEFKIPVMKGREITSRGTLMTELKESGEDAQIIEKVKVARLDNWPKIQQFTRIDLIKIDVEGNEAKTLEGAEKTIRKHKPTLMVEIEQRHHEEPIWNLISKIEGWGYHAMFLDRTSLKLEKLTKDFFESQDQANVKNYRNYINNIIFVPEKN